MKRIKVIRFIAAFTFSAAVLTSYLGFINPTVVLGSTRIQNPDSTCAIAAFRALVHEDQNYANDSLWMCGSVSDLDNIAHTLSGDCHSVVFKLSDTWNDCISSVSWWVPINRKLQIWSESGYRGAIFEVNNCGGGSTWVGHANIPVPPGDYASSVRFLSC